MALKIYGCNFMADLCCNLIVMTQELNAHLHFGRLPVSKTSTRLLQGRAVGCKGDLVRLEVLPRDHRHPSTRLFVCVGLCFSANNQNAGFRCPWGHHWNPEVWFLCQPGWLGSSSGGRGRMGRTPCALRAAGSPSPRGRAEMGAQPVLSLPFSVISLALCWKDFSTEQCFSLVIN